MWLCNANILFYNLTLYYFFLSYNILYLKKKSMLCINNQMKFALLYFFNLKEVKYYNKFLDFRNYIAERIE